MRRGKEQAVSVTMSAEDDDGYRLAVRVRDRLGETRHDVTLSRDLLARLSPGEAADDFVRRCFSFLLEREPKDSILSAFDVSSITRYFPEFEREIRR